jgi:hypothetical protein
LAQYTRGTQIRNVRQLSILSERTSRPSRGRWGLPGLPPDRVRRDHGGARHTGLHAHPAVVPFAGRDSGATLTVDMENRPCHLVSKEVEALHPGFGKAFKPAATGRRGVTAWVEREGEIRLGARLRLHIPDQPHWPHARSGAIGVDPAQTTLRNPTAAPIPTKSPQKTRKPVVDCSIVLTSFPDG